MLIPGCSPTIEARFWKMVDKRGKDECWPWLGHKLPQGYGQMCSRTGHKVKSHRVAYYLAHGRWPMPTADHTCDNRSCCNARHLVEATVLANVMRGKSGDRLRSGKCRKGHPLIPSNIYLHYRKRSKFPQLLCKICKRAAVKASYVRRRAKVVSNLK